MQFYVIKAPKGVRPGSNFCLVEFRNEDEVSDRIASIASEHQAPIAAIHSVTLQKQTLPRVPKAQRCPLYGTSCDFFAKTEPDAAPEAVLQHFIQKHSFRDIRTSWTTDQSVSEFASAFMFHTSSSLSLRGSPRRLVQFSIDSSQLVAYEVAERFRAAIAHDPSIEGLLCAQRRGAVRVHAYCLSDEIQLEVPLCATDISRLAITLLNPRHLSHLHPICEWVQAIDVADERFFRLEALQNGAAEVAVVAVPRLLQVPQAPPDAFRCIEKKFLLYSFQQLRYGDAVCFQLRPPVLEWPKQAHFCCCTSARVLIQRNFDLLVLVFSPISLCLALIYAIEASSF